jgi:hypothetical protein
MRTYVVAAFVLLMSPIAALAQSSSVPSDCVPAWGRYSAAPSPKAFAAGTTQGCGWQINNDRFPDAASIRAQALRQCAESAGTSGGCRIISQSN